RWTWNAKTDASGRIATVGFPTNAVRFSVTPPTGPYFDQGGFSLPAAGSLDVTFPPTATVRGVVHDYDGAALPGVSVGLFTSDFSAVPGTISGDDGSYALTVPTGSYAFSLSRTFSP